MKTIIQFRVPEEMVDDLEAFKKSRSEEFGFQIKDSDAFRMIFADGLRFNKKKQEN